jgi:hypothetical protein
VSTITPLVSGHYCIEVTAAQREGLKTALSYAQVCVKADICKAQENEAFWLAKDDATAEQLALAQTNLATFRQYLAGFESVVPAVFGAKFVSTRRRCR